MQSRADAGLYGAERLVQPLRGFGMRKSAEKRRFDCLALVGRQGRQRGAQRFALLAQFDDVLGIGSLLGQRLHIVGAAAFFRFSKRSRSSARDRAWFMIQASTVPWAGSKRAA